MPQIKTVYVLFRETNSGDGDDSDGYIEGVYPTRQKAERAMLGLRRRAIREGEEVYWDEDNQTEGASYWTHDWRVEEWPITRRVPRLVRAPRCNDNGDVINPL